MSEWKVENIATLANGKKAKDISSNALYPIYGGNGIMGYTNSFNASNVVIIGRVGAYCGSVHYSKEKCWISDNAISAMAKDNNSTEYLYYLLTSLHLNRHHIGGAQPLMTQGIINNIDIPKYSNSEQKKIAGILSALDEKIETNRKINARLEELAQAIFKSWFIDFEPFGGKMPLTWKNCKLEDIAKISSGKRPSDNGTKFVFHESYPIVGASSIMGYTSNFLYDEPILVIGRVGTHGIVQRWKEKCWPSDNTLVIKSKYYNFAYNVLMRIDYSALNRGSTQPLITQTDIKQIELIFPTLDILDVFENKVTSIFNQIEILSKESARLAALRDTLLPKLMSGELIPE